MSFERKINHRFFLYNLCFEVTFQSLYNQSKLKLILFALNRLLCELTFNQKTGGDNLNWRRCDREIASAAVSEWMISQVVTGGINKFESKLHTSSKIVTSVPTKTLYCSLPFYGRQSEALYHKLFFELS